MSGRRILVPLKRYRITFRRFGAFREVEYVYRVFAVDHKAALQKAVVMLHSPPNKIDPKDGFQTEIVQIAVT